MTNVNVESIAGFKISNFFGSGQDSISLEKVEAFLKKAVSVASEHADLAPNQLVRVVNKGQVLWMTQKQAVDFLERATDPDIQKEVEKALRGDVKYIRQELEILLAIAFYTLNKYKESEDLKGEDINRIQPSLQRRQKEIADGISQSAESEAILAEKRRRNPVISQYEDKMGDFLDCKAKGDMTKASVLAKELAAQKKQYLLHVRAIEPDVRTIYYHRLNLQKTKKRIINTQSEICSSRRDFLELEVSELRNSLESIQEEMEIAGEEGFDSAAAQIKKMELYDPEEIEKEIEEKTLELDALDAESAILERQEEETSAVINHIAEDVLQEQELKVDMSEVKHTKKPIISDDRKKQSSVAKQKRTGMHVSKFKDR